MIKVRMGDIFGGFDDAEVIELNEDDGHSEDFSELEKDRLNDYKQDKVQV